MEDLRGTIASTNQANQHLIAEVKLLREQVAYLTDKRFGRSKETLSNQVSGQLSLFSEDQPSEATCSAETPATQTASAIEVNQHRRKAGQKAAKIAHLPVIDQHHTLA
ncbi:transposase domain-containing protein, partial [Vagococcus acidifermentans]